MEDQHLDQFELKVGGAACFNYQLDCSCSFSAQHCEAEMIRSQLCHALHCTHVSKYLTVIISCLKLNKKNEAVCVCVQVFLMLWGPKFVT